MKRAFKWNKKDFSSFLKSLSSQKLSQTWECTFNTIHKQPNKNNSYSKKLLIWSYIFIYADVISFSVASKCKNTQKHQQK